MADVAIKAKTAATQPNGGRAVVSVPKAGIANGQNVLTSPVGALDDTVANMDTKLDNRFDDARYYTGDAS